MNHKAIDAGATAFVQVDVPEAWKTAEAAPKTSDIDGRPETVALVTNIMEPVARMDGDSPARVRLRRLRGRPVPAGCFGL